MSPRARHPGPAALVALVAALAIPFSARSATLAIEDPLVSRDECVARNAQELALEWDLAGASGDSVEILGSDASGCSETDATTAVLVDGLSTSQVLYPASGDDPITVADILAAAGGTVGSCDGSDFRVYVCVRLIDSSGSSVATASAALKLQLELPPAPGALSVEPGEEALHVSWTEGAATADAPAASKTFRVFASAGGVTRASSETSGTSIRLDGLENGTTYDVWIVAYSEAGNASASSELSAGTPQPVQDFFEAYAAAGGVEQGGCSQGGASGPLGVAAVAWLLRRRRRTRWAANNPSSPRHMLEPRAWYEGRSPTPPDR